MTEAHTALTQRLNGLASQVKTMNETLLPTLDERIQQQITPLAEQIQQQTVQLAELQQAQQRIQAVVERQHAAITELWKPRPLQQQGRDRSTG